MARHSKKRDNQTSTARTKASLSSSKSKSRSKGSHPHSRLKRWPSGETPGSSAVSWKHLRKQWPWLKQLKPHQERGAEAILSTDGFAALFAQRTGKTWVTGAVLCAEYGRSLDVLLVGPLTNLKSTWEKFLKERLPHYSVHRDLDSYLEHQKKFEKAWGHRDHCILLLNPEQITKSLLKRLRRVTWDRMIWDEAQRLKNRTSRSSRDAALIAGSAHRRLALTGTPIDRNPKDMWAIMRFVEVNVFGNVWKDFEEHFIEKPTIDLSKKMRPMQRQRMMLAYQIAKRKAPFRADRLDEYAELISPHVLRISKEDAGIEPAKVKVIRFDLDPGEDKKYRKLEKNMIVKHQGVTIKTPLKITQIGKLQQMTGGYIKDEEGEVHCIGTSKRRKLRSIIREHVHEEPFVVFCKHVWEVHMIARVLRRLGYERVAELWGKVKDTKKDPRRTNMLLDFQRGKLDAMVCQQRTGGVGVDLYRARKFFVYSMGHSFIDYDQMLSRGDFLDQEERAEFFLLAVRSSIDTDIIVSVKDKKSITEQFYGRLTQNH